MSCRLHLNYLRGALMAVAASLFIVNGAMAEVVKGTSDPWLSGLPDGATASLGDQAPAQSPMPVTSVDVSSASSLLFSAAGSVSYGPAYAPTGPDGGLFFQAHRTGAENGIAAFNAPINSLVGVFLTDDSPLSSVIPVGLDFAVIGLDFDVLAPVLMQPFFIGDGLTGSGGGDVQQFLVPAGATRLYLGVTDGFGWYNNIGAFDVTITAMAVGSGSVPEPGSLMLLAVGLSALVGRRNYR